METTVEDPEALQEDEICIKIPNKEDFYCENTWTIGEAQDKIQKIYHITWRN